MTFSPTADKLLPDLTPEEEIVLLARTLWREGYNDHLAGHITYNLGDGTLLCNPWLLTWDEIRPRDIIRIDLDGNVLEGDWPAPLGIPLHLELHKARHDVQVAMHSHPLYGTVWSDMREVPPVYDQSSGLGGGGDLVLVDEYGGAVNSADAAREAIVAMGDARGTSVPRAATPSPPCRSGGSIAASRATATASSASGRRWCARSCARTRRCSKTTRFRPAPRSPRLPRETTHERRRPDPHQRR
jgi:hypothetical protein